VPAWQGHAGENVVAGCVHQCAELGLDLPAFWWIGYRSPADMERMAA
jgi:hypothetical protein